MKICAYEIADFEIRTFEELSKETGVEIVWTKEPLLNETLSLAEGCDGISILGYTRVDEDYLKKLKDMGIMHVSTRTIGFDHIDVKKAKEMGMHVYHAYYQPDNVADFAVMLMLMTLRRAKVSVCRALVNDFSLDGMMGREMHSLTVGVIGTGKIGSTVIRDLSGFGCRIICYDKFENPAVREKAEYVSLDTLYQESDIITLHCPLTEDNYHMIDEAAFAKMKKGVILINTARGKLIDTESLIKALEEEKVGGAGIDTLEEEAGVMHVDVGTRIIDKRSLLYVKQFPNVIYTSHYAFFTQEATESMTRCGIQSIVAGLKGETTPCEI